jgi:hypothetical protein
MEREREREKKKEEREREMRLKRATIEGGGGGGRKIYNKKKMERRVDDCKSIGKMAISLLIGLCLCRNTKGREERQSIAR